MAAAPTSMPTVAPARPAVSQRPPLESGMRLTSVEFERRYELYPEIRRAELIEGVVYVSSPMRHELHGKPSLLVGAWLGAYIAQMEDTVDGGEGSTVRLDPDNNVQPDAFLRRPEGASRLTEDGYLAGPVELVVEVAASSVSADMGPKRNAYRRNGVLEYIVWQIYENKLDWFWLTPDGDYESLLPDDRGVIESRVFPGLRLLVPALLARDFAAVLAEQNASG